MRFGPYFSEKRHFLPLSPLWATICEGIAAGIAAKSEGGSLVSSVWSEIKEPRSAIRALKLGLSKIREPRSVILA
jgi:hypothetical protein